MKARLSLAFLAMAVLDAGCLQTSGVEPPAGLVVLTVPGLQMKDGRWRLGQADIPELAEAARQGLTCLRVFQGATGQEAGLKALWSQRLPLTGLSAPIPVERETFAETFIAQGYETAVFGLSEGTLWESGLYQGWMEWGADSEAAPWLAEPGERRLCWVHTRKVVVIQEVFKLLRGPKKLAFRLIAFGMKEGSAPAVLSPWPEQAGKVEQEALSALDLLPTMAALMKLPAPKGSQGHLLFSEGERGVFTVMDAGTDFPMAVPSGLSTIVYRYGNDVLTLHWNQELELDGNEALQELFRRDLEALADEERSPVVGRETQEFLKSLGYLQ